jgi:RNA polymerase sigma-70 factor (ECF subfamily)
MVRHELSKPNPLITENAVLAEVYQRLSKAIQKENVNPKTAREFFGLSAQHIRWQIRDMLRKRTSQQAGEDVLSQITGGSTPLSGAEEGEKWELFWSAVDSLANEEREVFDLVWLNGLSQYEAAETIGKTRNQIDSIWRRIKIKIVKACKDYAAFDA